MTRGNWFTTNVIGKICQKLYVRLDHDFPFATLKSVCVEDQHGRVVFTVPSTCVHKPLPAGRGNENFRAPGEHRATKIFVAPREHGFFFFQV